jgi:hypothetical protein
VFLTFGGVVAGSAMLNRKGYVTDVSDEEWAFAAPLSVLDERRGAAAGISVA